MKWYRDFTETTLIWFEKMPAWVPMMLIFLIVLWRYEIVHDQFLQRVVDTVLGGLLGILVGRRVAPSNPLALPVPTPSNYTVAVTTDSPAQPQTDPPLGDEERDTAELAHLNDEPPNP